MAKFATFLIDPDLESNVLKAIAAVKGELLLRAVTIQQIEELARNEIFTLVTEKRPNLAIPQLIIDSSFEVSDIVEILESKVERQRFDKGGAKVVCFVGLSGGVGTTTIAINHAFEKSQSTTVTLIDLNEQRPDVALALGLHRIDTIEARISKNLSAVQGLPRAHNADYLVFDLGTELGSSILEIADEIYVVTRAGFNTLARLKSLELQPNAVIFNFAERSKAQQFWRSGVLTDFPRLKCINIPFDSRSFEIAAQKKSALLETAANSLARKSIATLG